MKNNSKHGNFAQLFFPVFNLLILSLYLVNFDLPKKSTFYFFLLSLVFLCFLSIVTIKLSFSFFKYLNNLQLSFFSILLLFLSLELLFKSAPGLFPQEIRNYVYTDDLNKSKEKMVEYLNESPYVKFKPNTIIRSQGYRGNSKEFAYEWKTDKLGFKNLELVTKQEQVDVVAIGNSFTEGMGVATDKIWPSILTENGFLTYNLGVQGYAPVQFEGSLKKYGLKLKPEYVVIGYFSGIFARESAFLNNKNEVDKENKFTGGIQSIIDSEKRGEIKLQAKYLSSALFLSTAGLRLKIRLFIKNYFSDVSVSEAFKSSQFEINNIEKESMTNEIISKSKPWENTLEAFKNIKRMSDDINAKVIILYFTGKGESYFEKATGEKMPERYFAKIESDLLQDFANNNSIMYVNISERIREYVNSLPDDFDIDLLPYLVNDGHMNNIGHGLVAQEIMSYLRLKIDQE